MAILRNSTFKKTICIISLLFFTFARCGNSFAQNDNGGATWSEGAQTAFECQIFYQTLQLCVGSAFPDNKRKDLATSAEFMSKLGWLLAKKAGLSDEAIKARGHLIIKSFTDKLDHNCVNISILLRDYSDLCKGVFYIWKDKLAD